MSEEQKKEVAPETQQTEEVKVEAPKQQTFTQDQLDNIIKARLESEKNKHTKHLDEIKQKEVEALKEKEVKEKRQFPI